MARVFLVNFAADYPAVNAVYAAHLKTGPIARTLSASPTPHGGAIVEMDLIAAL